MKSTAVIFFFMFVFFQINAQSRGVEKSMFQVQAGLFGIWGSNELKITNTLALHSEVGFDYSYGGKYYYDNQKYYSLAPSFTESFKWYYGIEKREARGKNTANNSSCFLSLNLHYMPDWFMIGGNNAINVESQLVIVPTWGIRRSIGNHLSFETSLGFGWRHYYYEGTDGNELAIEPAVKVGYTF